MFVLWYFLYAFACFSTLFLLGIGITLLFCPSSFRRYALLISPVIGFCYLCLLSWYGFQLDLPGTDSYAIWFPVSGLVWAALGINTQHKRPGGLRALFHSELLIAIGLALICFIFVSIPHFTHLNFLSPLSIGNNDLPNYAAVSRYIQEFRKSDVTTGYLGQDVVLHRLAIHEYFGPFGGFAAISAILRTQPDKVLSFSAALFFSIGLLQLFTLARLIFRYELFGAVVVCLAYSLNSLGFNAVFNGFEAQLIAMPMMTLLVAFGLKSLEEAKHGALGSLVYYAPITALLMVAFSTTYGHMLILTCGLLSGCALFSYFVLKRVKPIASWFSVFFLAFILSLLLAPARAITLFELFHGKGVETNAWHVPWISPDLLLGLNFLLLLEGANTLLRWIITVPALVTVIWGLKIAYRRDRFLFCLNSFISCALIVGYCFLGIHESDSRGFGGYKSYKLISFYMPVILAIAYFGLARRGENARARFAFLGFISLCLLVNATASVLEFKRLQKSALNLKPGIRQLDRIDRDASIASVNLRVKYNYWESMWENYFLMRKTTYFSARSYRPPSPLLGDWDIVTPNYGEALDPKNRQIYDLMSDQASYADPETKIQLADDYWALRRRHFPIEQGQQRFGIAVTRGTGWNKFGTDPRRPGDASGVSEIHIQSSASRPKFADLRTFYDGPVTDAGIDVELNHVMLPHCTYWGCILDNLKISPGANLLAFHYAKANAQQGPPLFSVIDLEFHD